LNLSGRRRSRAVSLSKEFYRKSGKILLLQREIPEHVNVIAARVAREAGTLVILDMGGRDEPLSDDLLKNVDIISPNEVPSHA